MKRLIVAAFITDADDDRIGDLVEAMGPLKTEGTTGGMAAFDVGNPLNMTIYEELRSLDLAEVADEVLKLHDGSGGVS